MGFRDPLAAAQARIEQLSAKVGELLRVKGALEIEKQNLEAELQIQKLEAKREVSTLETQRKIDDAVLRSQLETKVLALERRVAELDAALETARATIARLEGRPDR